MSDSDVSNIDINNVISDNVSPVGHLEGVNRWQANLVHNNAELKTNYAN